VHINGVYLNYNYQVMIIVYPLQILNVVRPSLMIRYDSDLRKLSSL